MSKPPNDQWTNRFIKVWNRSGDVNEVAEAMQINRQTAKHVAWRLRRNGCELKEFKPGFNVDYAPLRALARRTLREYADKVTPRNRYVAARESFFLDFIPIWQRAYSIADVERRFNLPKGRASILAAQLRYNYNVPLKRFPSNEMSWGALRKAAIETLEAIKAGNFIKLTRIATRHKQEPMKRSRRRRGSH